LSEAVIVDVIRHSTLLNIPHKLRVVERIVEVRTDLKVASAFRAELEALLANLARRRPSFRAVLEPTSFQAPAVATDPAAPLVRLAGQVAAAHGFDPAPVGVDYATDAAILAASGVPVIIIGPGSIDQAHTADEFVELDQVLAGACYYADLIGRPL
jgi:acetylornithine deacetylase